MIEENLPISWLGLPDGIDQLDAAFVWGKNKKTYFFRYIHHFDINETASLYLFSTGAETEKKKKKTISLSHFRKNLYWRYDDIKRQMDPGYPHDLSRWRGVVSDIDAAMQWTDGKVLIFKNIIRFNCIFFFWFFNPGRTYFFKDKMFWRFDDTLVRTDMRYPQEATPYWLGCPE